MGRPVRIALSSLAVRSGVPKEKAGILVDEQFGVAILRRKVRHGSGREL